MQLLALGLFLFGMDTLAFNKLERTANWRHGRQERFKARPATQFLGPGDDSITLNGVLVPELVGNRSAIQTLHDMADTGDAHALMLGNGERIGDYVIKTVTESQSYFVDGGISRKNDFSVTLERVD